MIQRKQSVYLLISVILSAVCMFLPIGKFISENMGADSTLYNIAIKGMDGSVDYVVCILFVLLLISTVSSLLNIFLYKNRKIQSKICKANMLVLVVWYAAYVYFAFAGGGEGTEFSFGTAAVMPFFAIIAQILANNGIRSDEELIRSMDRIR